MLSCKFWETSKNTFFTEHLRWLLLYFIFLKKNLFQFKNFLHKKFVLMYQWPKCPYSYISQALEFDLKLFFSPVTILKK